MDGADQTVTAPTKIANRLNRFLAKSFPLKTSPATRKTKRLAAKIKMLEVVNLDPKTVKAATKCATRKQSAPTTWPQSTLNTLDQKRCSS